MGCGFCGAAKPPVDGKYRPTAPEILTENVKVTLFIDFIIEAYCC